ncbi:MULTISPECIES: restriction endonuclease subunit S [Streptomyces]|uniref:Restriction endonuclease subunit S n=1 Tax=Streptomyces fuscus TaxID=3048495 RepID=A0ABT7J1Y8_9ACTN|nr:MULTISPECIES: restriction endonuclease subunit S [Streptomyces]MCM1968784.1 restriction endonuclease subunit S [Streptomyces sp. G1]MDL2078871.1 restriction endonuclease subunit S [Streptomyces fuscus]SBT93510.1 type I restriction enzyme, S subunit [Streptomyces sp. DI166]
MTDRWTEEAALPTGWSRPLLKELWASAQTGPSRRPADRERTVADGGAPVVLPRDLRGLRVVTGEPRDIPAIPWDRARMLARYELAAGDVLVTRTGTVGRCALVTGEHQGWLFHPNLVRLRLPKGGRVTAAYLAAYLGTPTAQDWIRTRTAVAVIPSLSIRTLGELPVVLPPLGEQEAIGATLAALDDKIQAHSEIIRATRAYRDLLADALMNGALPVES